VHVSIGSLQERDWEVGTENILSDITERNSCESR